MSLSLYKKKRRFNETPEPEGKEKSSKKGLRFVVQKHDASHLHYDFRLELDGVLKSWAVPKGPSLNPGDKRLAMMVEDHPYDYRDFEGVIPEGNYGGGTVIVWDEGYYEPLEGEDLSPKEQEKLLRKQLYSGNMKIVLHGTKLNGAFGLFLMKGRGERSWILNKKQDDFVSEEDITLEDKSVKTGKSMMEVAAENGTSVNHPELHIQPEVLTKKVKSRGTAKPVKKVPKKKTAAKKTKTGAARKGNAGLLDPFSAGIQKKAFPKELVPMMATLTDEPFNNDEWLFEIKWDGYRSVAYCKGNGVELVSRNLTSFTEKYQPVTEALRELELNAVLDGEIVAVDEKGLAVFQSLQNWQNTPVRLQYFVFDILWLEGYDLTRLTLEERKHILKLVLPADNEVIKYSDHVIGKGKDFFQAAIDQGLEGIMAKKAGSIYQIGARTDSWVKIKVSLRQEVVIAGFTEPRNSRKFFGSLLLGLYENDKLVYVGHTGSGFNTKSLEAIYSKLQPLVSTKCPFEKCPKGNMPVTWVKPKLVCEIKFTEWTKDRIARHPIFMGLRTDKKPKEVKFEKTVTLADLNNSPEAKENKKKITRTAPKKKAGKPVVRKMATARKTPAPAKKTAIKKPTAKKTTAKKAEVAEKKSGIKSSATGKTSSPGMARNPLVTDYTEDQKVELSGETVQLTNLEKPYWKKEGFSKGDMINYYHQIAPYMMPYLLDRPHSLNRHPNGVGGPNFYQKDVKGKVPDWIRKHVDFSESTNENVEYLVCANEATLIYMANMGCIEINPWHSRTASVQNPDWCLIDLDPDKSNTFEQVMEAARLVKNVLDSIGATACCKTSGSTGIHIYIPLGARYDYDQSKQLAELVVNIVNQQWPDMTSVERSPAKRKGKIYLDFLQNRDTQTAAAPYSLRPKPGVPVSTPLDWSELKKGLTQQTWNARNIFERLKSEGDLFKPVLGKGIDLKNVLGKLAEIMK